MLTKDDFVGLGVGYHFRDGDFFSSFERVP